MAEETIVVGQERLSNKQNKFKSKKDCKFLPVRMLAE